MIRMVVFDIDGIITDNTIVVDPEGHECKRINFKDMDAVHEIRNMGLKIAALTGEQTPMTEYFKNRFPWDEFITGAKNKKEKLTELIVKYGITSEELCYIGEGKYDVEALEYAGLGVCPSDAIPQAREASDIVLERRGGDGCVWELAGIIRSFNADKDDDYVIKRLNEHEKAFKLIRKDDELRKAIVCVGDVIEKSLRAGGRLLLCGNGGSAADAQHIAAEFTGRFYKERAAMDAEALNVNTSVLTAIGNDYDYNRVFARQVEAKGGKGDVLIGISTSGSSSNVLAALKTAKDIGMNTVLLTSICLSKDADIPADHIIRIPSDMTPRIQEAHIFVGHLWAEYVEEHLF